MDHRGVYSRYCFGQRVCLVIHFFLSVFLGYGKCVIQLCFQFFHCLAIVLTDPVTYDNYNATMTVRFESVPSSYALNDVKTRVSDMLKEIGQYNYTEWTSTSLAERTLLKKNGYYANYRGVQYDGTIVRGRVMVALLDGNRIITLHMSGPAGYNESYMNVVSHFRETLKQIQ